MNVNHLDAAIERAHALAACVPSSSLPSAWTLALTHAQLDALLRREAPAPALVSRRARKGG